MNHKYIITERSGIVRYGYFADGQPVELYCEPKEPESLIGNIYAARIERVADGIGGAFLEIRDNHGKNSKCFFRLPKGGQQPVRLSPGQEDKLRGGDIILVQITKDAVKTKLPVAEGNISLTGKYFVLTLGDKRSGVSKKIRNTEERKRLSAIADAYKEDTYGIVVRTNAEEAPEEELNKELAALTARYQSLMKKAAYAEGRTLLYREPPQYVTLAKELPKEELDEIITDSPEIYEELRQYYGDSTPLPSHSKNPAAHRQESSNGICRITFYTDTYPLEKLYRFEHFYETALQKTVWLPSGGSLVIEPTEAMVVIDVNSGSVTKKKKHADKIFFEMNREAATEIARQLRLRNLSGIIVIDFINMESREQRQELLAFLEKECKKDRVNCQVIDMTALGLVEMIRSKKQKPLHEQMRDVKNFGAPERFSRT